MFSLRKKKEWGVFSREVPDVGPQLLGVEEELTAFVLVGLVDLMLIYDDFL